MNQGAKGHVYSVRKNIHIALQAFLATYPWSRGLTGVSIHHRIHVGNGRMTLGGTWPGSEVGKPAEILDCRIP
jgi:hypothetical protein